MLGGIILHRKEVENRMKFWELTIISLLVLVTSLQAGVEDYDVKLIKSNNIFPNKDTKRKSEVKKNVTTNLKRKILFKKTWKSKKQVRSAWRKTFTFRRQKKARRQDNNSFFFLDHFLSHKMFFTSETSLLPKVHPPLPFL